MQVKVKIYDKCKYHKGSKVIAERFYNIDGYKVVNKSDNLMYALGFDEVDDFQEYLVLKLKGGEIATFRNSYVDMFKEV